MHVRLYLQTTNIDIGNAYRYLSHDQDTDNLAQMEDLLDSLSSAVLDSLTFRPSYKDKKTFEDLLQQHGLEAINTWDTKFPARYQGPRGASSSTSYWSNIVGTHVILRTSWIYIPTLECNRSHPLACYDPLSVETMDNLSHKPTNQKSTRTTLAARPQALLGNTGSLRSRPIHPDEPDPPRLNHLLMKACRDFQPQALKDPQMKEGHPTQLVLGDITHLSRRFIHYAAGRLLLLALTARLQGWKRQARLITGQLSVLMKAPGVELQWIQQHLLHTYPGDDLEVPTFTLTNSTLPLLTSFTNCNTSPPRRVFHHISLQGRFGKLWQ